MFETREQIKGYKYSCGCGGKSWTRGRIRFSEGRYWYGTNKWTPVITKTNLDTGDVTVASISEAKRFLTEEGYKKYLMSRFVQLAMEEI